MTVITSIAMPSCSSSSSSHHNIAITTGYCYTVIHYQHQHQQHQHHHHHHHHHHHYHHFCCCCCCCGSCSCCCCAFAWFLSFRSLPRLCPVLLPPDVFCFSGHSPHSCPCCDRLLSGVERPATRDTSRMCPCSTTSAHRSLSGAFGTSTAPRQPPTSAFRTAPFSRTFQNYRYRSLKVYIPYRSLIEALYTLSSPPGFSFYIGSPWLTCRVCRVAV